MISTAMALALRVGLLKSAAPGPTMPHPLRRRPTSDPVRDPVRPSDADVEAVLGAADVRGLSRRLFGAAAMTAAAFATSPAAAAADPRRAPVFPTPTGRVRVLHSSPDTVRVGAMDPAAPAAIEIESGEVVHYPDTWVNWANEAKLDMSFAEREPIRRKYPQGPYSLVGPVVVRGAEPGDIIECRMVRLRPIAWGWNSAPKGVGALPADFAAPYLHYVRFDAARRFGEFAPGVRIRLAPIQGVMAAEPISDKPVSAILSGPYGGNLVLRDLVEGSALFLPVQVAGGRLWTGDSHAAQGDGVVDQTGIETAMEDLRIQYVLHKRRPLAGPIAETADSWIVLGHGPTLEDALTTALRRTISWLSPATGLPALDVYALCSMAGSFRVTQYANQTNSNYTSAPPKGIHVVLPKAIFDAPRQAQISRSLRSGAGA